jgi:enoyl-CoA hydratase/carnithine racemase
MDATRDACRITREQDGVARMTIGDARKANILNTPAMARLLAEFEVLARDRTLRALVLTGSGDRSFVGGADIREMAGLDQASAKLFIGRLRAVCEAVRAFPALVVARINGACLGGGLELAMACDLRVASTAAKFAMPEVRLGIPSVIHAALMPRLIGASRARWMMLTGATIDAQTALDWGLVNAVAPPDELDAAVAVMIAPILECGPQAIHAQKMLLREWEELPLSEAVAASIPVFARAFATGEPQRYMNDFLRAKQKSGRTP